MNYTLTITEFKEMINDPTVSNLELVQVSKSNSRFKQLLDEKDDRYFEVKTPQQFEEMCQEALKSIGEIYKG